MLFGEAHEALLTGRSGADHESTGSNYDHTVHARLTILTYASGYREFKSSKEAREANRRMASIRSLIGDGSPATISETLR